MQAIRATARTLAAVLAAFVLSVAVLAAAAFVPSGYPVARAAAAQGRSVAHRAAQGMPRGCVVNVRTRIDRYGHEEIWVSGHCHGHAPTAADVRRMLSIMVLPAGLHIGRTVHDDTCGNSHRTSRAVIVWGGNGNTSALVCVVTGRAYVS